MRTRYVILSAAAVVATAVFGAVPASASTTPLPASMASTGDSITRAYDVNWLHLLSDSPQYSWSTGNSSSVTSQYQRILALNPTINGHQYNDAKTGADMSALDGQVKAAASQGVQYLTVLMGANDLCTSSAATMTSTAAFTSELQTALRDFTAMDPSAKIFVSSIPDIYQLWNVLHTNPAAASAWHTFGICPSMLSSTNSPADRDAVVKQETLDNQALQTVCVQFPLQCRWDQYATYNFKFPTGDVSTVDYFHPNLAGQNDLARVSWAASYWAS